MSHTAPDTLVLGSTSPFRKELLERLGIPFITDKPDIDETRHDNESPEELVKRLSLEKARAVANLHPDALVIGSDQVAVLDNQVLGKPHTHEKAVMQLKAASGKRVKFLTGLCLINTRNGDEQVDLIPFDVVFRELSEDKIEAYLHREQPYNCAGSFKSEALGIALFQSMEGTDPSALMGLPLIRLVNMLEEQSVSVL